MHVAIVRSDVKVAGERQLRISGELLGEPFVQRCQPGELVVVLIAADGLAVRYIRTDDAHTADGRGDQALLRIAKMRISADHVGEFAACQQSNAVVSLLPGEGDLVTGCLDLGSRKVCVFELRLLEANDVGLLRREPLEQLRQANLQRVDVPGGEPHSANAPDGLAPKGADLG